MTKIICKTLETGSLDSQKYKGPSGHEYEFFRGRGTDVTNPEDAISFLNAGRGESFAIDAPASKIREIYEGIKQGVKNSLAQKEAAARVVENEKVAEAVKIASVDDHYGLNDEEYKEVLEDGTIKEYSELTMKADAKKARSALAKWAKDEFDIKLSQKDTLVQMGAAFWVAWRNIVPPEK